MINYYIIFLFILTVFIPAEIIPENKQDLNLVLVYPGLTKKLLHNADSKFSPTDEWELFLMSNNLKYRMIEDKDLDEIKDEDDVVIIPSLEAISAEMIENIEEILREGKGILITGNFAEFDVQGKRNNDLQRNLLNFHIVSIPEINSISISHTLIGNTPLSFNLKPGFNILLKSKPDIYCGSEISENCKSAGYYFPINKTFPDSLTGIISQNKFAGRLLWCGFDFNQMIGNERNKFLLNSFNYLASKPEAYVNYFPDKYKSAGIIFKNIDQPSDLNFLKLSTVSQKINFIINPGMFEKSGDDIKRITDSSDIVILWDDFFFSNISSSAKGNWLKKTKSFAEDITNQTYFGISSYSGQNDSTTINYLKDAGYSFIFSPGYSDAFAIDFDSTSKNYYFINSSIAGLNETEGFNFIIKNKGIFYLNGDSILVGGKFKPYTDNPAIWFTTFSDLLNWILKREQIEVTINSLTDEYEVRIRNNSSSGIENIGIWLSIPDINGNLHIKNQDNSVKFTFDSYEKMYFLNISKIEGYKDLLYNFYKINE